MRLKTHRIKWAARATAWFVECLGYTIWWRTEVPNATQALFETDQPVIFAFWHSRLLLLPIAYRSLGRKQIYVLISLHRDGELISQVIAHFNLGRVRGSTRHHAFRALRTLLCRVARRADLALTPDGPRGPAFRVQPGIVALARRTGYPIVPVTYSTRWAVTFNSWDRFFLPLPFCRGIFLWGEPMWPGDDELEQERRSLQRDLRALTYRADREVGRSPEAELEGLTLPYKDHPE